VSPKAGQSSGATARAHAPSPGRGPTHSVHAPSQRPHFVLPTHGPSWCLRSVCAPRCPRPVSPACDPGWQPRPVAATHAPAACPPGRGYLGGQAEQHGHQRQRRAQQHHEPPHAPRLLHQRPQRRHPAPPSRARPAAPFYPAAQERGGAGPSRPLGGAPLHHSAPWAGPRCIAPPLSPSDPRAAAAPFPVSPFSCSCGRSSRAAGGVRQRRRFETGSESKSCSGLAACTLQAVRPRLAAPGTPVQHLQPHGHGGDKRLPEETPQTQQFKYLV